MAKIIVSVLFEGSNQLRDFEVPNDLTVSELLKKLAFAFPEMRSQGKWVGFQLIAAEQSEILEGNRTLEQAGVWDGAVLFIHPYKIVQKPRESVHREKESPLVGWKALGTFYGEKKASKVRSTTKFVWKRLD